MSTTAPEHEPIDPHGAVPTDVLDGAVAPYSRDKVYVVTAIALAVLTAIEVIAVEVDFVLWEGTRLLTVWLLVLMAIKFVIVASVFMHLKFDKPILTWVFYSGLVLAVAVYLGALTAFRLWWPGEHT